MDINFEQALSGVPGVMTVVSIICWTIVTKATVGRANMPKVQTRAAIAFACAAVLTGITAALWPWHNHVHEAAKVLVLTPSLVFGAIIISGDPWNWF